MLSDMRTYWRDLSYWRWLWQSRVSGDTKAVIALLVAVACGTGGYLAAQRLAADEEAATVTTERVVTVVRKASAPANTAPRVVTRSRTVTQPGETEVVTVRRDGRTIVVRAPGETITERRTLPARVRERVVTNARTDTVVQTETIAMTAPGTTETVTREVTLPAGTVTETDEVTVIEETTVTEEVTVTVTETETTDD